MQNTFPAILSIAGSDSGGGAGIQADIKTITCLDGYAMTAITALTAQNGLGVDAIFPISQEFMQKQLQTLFLGYKPKAAKTGMLFSQEIIDIVAKELKHYFNNNDKFPLVVDPVSVSQSGHKLLEDKAIEALIHKIIPLADVLTPNKPEAEALTEMQIESKEDVHKAGKILLNMGAKAVLIKGGHFESQKDIRTDWLITENNIQEFNQNHVETTNNHGTGCTLAAAIATFLGHGESVENAITKAQAYLNKALQKSFAPGLGHGSPCFKI